ncbi:MAG: hypothetical protein L3J17_11605 [Candidatus Jettenia sp.]|nr:MAG: hypothetical protein L3J17_11605 [Candidatus Jettenia sp.]
MELEDTPEEKQEQANGQGVPVANPIKVSFDETNYIVTINGKEYLFRDKGKRQLSKEYKFFELLYRNQYRYIKKDEIKKKLGLGTSADQQVFNTKSNLSKIIKDSSYEIENQKEYDNRGGYKLRLKQQN